MSATRKPAPSDCNCGADRTGPTAEAHLPSCPESGAPLQPGATQPEHDGVAHKLPALGLCERTFTHSELTTLLERMARLVVQEAVAICDEKDRLLKDDFETAKFLHTQSAIRALLAPGKLQQLREAVERP